MERRKRDNGGIVMSEVTEMMLDGTLCEFCGGLMDDLIVEGSKELKEPPGYPRKCEDCQNFLLEDE